MQIQQDGLQNIKKRRILQIVLIGVFVFFNFGFFNFYLSKHLVKKNLSSILEQYATEGNNECPIPVGDGNDLIVEKVFFLKEKTIVYEYRVLNYSKDDYDLQQLKEDMSKSALEDIESNKSLSKLRNNDVIFVYSFFDNQREEMFKIKILYNSPITIIDWKIFLIPNNTENRSRNVKKLSET